MLISSKGQYALRLMVDISINSGSTVTVKAVARRCGLSDKYLEQVTSSLLKAGYLRSVRLAERWLPSEHAGGGDHGWDGAKGDRGQDITN